MDRMNLKTGFNRPVQSQAVTWATAGLLADLRRCLRALPAARRRPEAGGKLRLQHAGIFERPEEARCMKLATSVPLKVKLHHSRAADSTISTVGITTVKSMIESSSLRSTSLVASDMKDPPAGVLS